MRATNVPGQATGALYVSGTTRDSKANGGGYFIARLNGNLVDAAPTAFAWVKNVWATGDHQVFQPWDVDGSGRVVYASGQPYGDDWAAMYRLKADGTPDVVNFANALEKVCIDTVEAGDMTKDLALLVGPDARWMTTTQFLDKLDQNLKKALA